MVSRSGKEHLSRRISIDQDPILGAIDTLIDDPSDSSLPAIILA